MDEYLGTIVDVEIDRGICSKHPEYNYFYPINYGYIRKNRGISKKSL